MSEEALKSVCAPGAPSALASPPPLCAPSLDPAAVSNQLELEMRFLVSEHRKVGRPTPGQEAEALDLNLELRLSPPGPEAGDRVGRPPVLPAVLCAVGLRAGALHQRFLRQRGVPGRGEDGRAGRAHL